MLFQTNMPRPSQKIKTPAFMSSGHTTVSTPCHYLMTQHDDSNDFTLMSNAINTICGCGHEFPQLKEVPVHSQSSAVRCAVHCSNGLGAVARSYPRNSVESRGFDDCCTQMHSDFAGKRMAVRAKNSHGRWLYGLCVIK